MSLPMAIGNLAIQRRAKGQLSLGLRPADLDIFRAALERIGAWRDYAEPRWRPESAEGALLLQVPPGFLPEMQDIEPKRQSNEFIVLRDALSLTIMHPGSDSRVRVVAKNYRYSPEQRGGPVLPPEPGEVPAISYNLIAPSDADPNEVLIAIGPGAFVEMDEPVPDPGMTEENLQEEWEHGVRPARLGHFDLTIVEMPDNELVPLPGEPIDAAALLAAGGRVRDPDQRTWRGALTKEDLWMFWAGLAAQLVMIALPLGFAALEAAALATRAAAMEAMALARAGALARTMGLAGESGAAASTAFETSAARLTTAAVTEEIPSVAGARAASPRVAGARAMPPRIGTPPIPVPEPVPAAPSSLAARLDAAFQSVGGRSEGISVMLVNDETAITTATRHWNVGIAAKKAGGATTYGRTVYVHEFVVEGDGVIRDWGMLSRKLSLRQVIAHEIGHIEAGHVAGPSFKCSLASAMAADNPNLTAAERIGLLEDAVRIAPTEKVPLVQLDLPPDFKLPTK